MGRQREFDREEVLDRAMTVFWSRGYEATSIEDLVTHMGIQRGSLYAAFGDKRALFLAALDRYERVVSCRLFSTLEVPGSGTEAIRRFFRLKVEASLERGRPGGCLLTNSAVEMSGGDRGSRGVVQASLARIEEAFLRALTRAREAGEIGAERDLRALARFLTSSAQGLSVMAKITPERAVLEDVVEVVMAVVDGRSPAARRGPKTARGRGTPVAARRGRDVAARGDGMRAARSTRAATAEDVSRSR